MSATVADLVAAISAEEGEPDAQGRPTFTTTSPNWWVGGRTFGGMVVAQALSAALQTAPAGFDVHSLHGYFLRPTAPGARTTHVVEAVRDGRSFSTRDVVSTVDGKDTFRMTCSFHLPEDGADYQLPMGPGIPPPGEIRGVRGTVSLRHPRARSHRAAAGRHVSVHAALLVPHPRVPARRPRAARLPAGLLLRHDRRRLQAAEPGHMGHAHRCEPRSRRLVPPSLASGCLEHLRPARPRQRGRPRHRPRHHAR